MTIEPPKLTSPQTGAWIQRLAYALGFAVAGVNPTNLTGAERIGVVIASAVLAAVDRYLSDPSTGTPTSQQDPPQVASKPTSEVPPTIAQS